MVVKLEPSYFSIVPEAPTINAKLSSGFHETLYRVLVVPLVSEEKELPSYLITCPLAPMISA